MPLRAEARGDGRPVVLLPPFSFDHGVMADVFEPLLEGGGWRRVYLDLPGTGGSPRSEPSSDAVLDEVSATIDSVVGNGGFLVAGWSYGGYLGAGLLRRARRTSPAS